MAFPATPLDVTVRLALGADLTADPSTWAWTDVTSYVRLASGIIIDRGRTDPYSTVPPQRLQLTLDNTDGRFSPRNPTGAYYGTINRNTPIQVRVDNGGGDVNRFTGHVERWPPRWDVTYTNRTAPITAAGPLSRTQRGEALRSALYRAHAIQAYSSSPAPKAYWPCEDEDGSLTIASAAAGGTPMSYTSVGLGDDADVDGSDPLMVLTASSGFNGLVPFHNTTSEWKVSCVMRIPSAPAGTVYPFGWYCNGTLNPWRLAIVPGSPDRLRVEAFNSAGTEMLSCTGADLETGAFGSLYGRQLYVEIEVVADGSGIDWDLSVWSVGGLQQELGTEASVTPGVVTGVALTGPSPATGVTLGHIAVWDDVSGGDLQYLAATGFAGETVAHRLIRLCAEGDIAHDINAPDRLTYMGVQDGDSLIGLLREGEAAEQGVMFETVDGTLDMLFREDRENRTVDLALDFDSKHIHPSFEPTTDDFGLVNDSEVSVSGGSSGRYVNRPHAVANGTYDERLTLNLDVNEEDPALHASWRVNVGSVDDDRYPSIALKLHATPALINDWLTCDIGSRITVDSPPPGLPPDLIDVHLEGYTETLTGYTWDVTMSTSSAVPWQVATVADGLELDAAPSIAYGSASQLMVDYNSAATSLLVANTSVMVPAHNIMCWSTTAEPYDWAVGGERVTVTTLVDVSKAFVGAGTGVHGDNASVQPDIHASAQKGDTVFILAAIRNTAATVNTPTGYGVVSNVHGHFALFYKTHSGSESTPTVTFSGGSSGDTTSAQTATFRGVYVNTDVMTTVGSNASAQDILTGPFTVTPKPNMLILLCAWKQDDWTSVSSPGTEIGEPDSTTGNDQGIVWSYVFQTSAAEIALSTFTVTGGASAISKDIIAAIPGDVQQATVTRSVNTVSKSQTAGTAVRLWRPTSIAL